MGQWATVGKIRTPEAQLCRHEIDGHVGGMEVVQALRSIGWSLVTRLPKRGVVDVGQVR